MPHFTFEIRSAGEPFDRIEMELPDLESAYNEAFLACSEMTRDISASPSVQHSWEIEVTDGGNDPVCLIRFSSWHR